MSEISANRTTIGTFQRYIHNREFPARKSPKIPGYSRLSPAISENYAFLLGKPQGNAAFLLDLWGGFVLLRQNRRQTARQMPRQKGKRRVSSPQPPRCCCSSTGRPPVPTLPQVPKACHNQSHTMSCGQIRNGYTSLSAPRPAFPALKAPAPP